MISLLSDLGSHSEAVGILHGVIARIAPGIGAIDITHDIAAGDVRAGALALTRSIQYLPAGVFVAAVGCNRPVRPLAALTEFGVFIGPDNGVLSPAVAMMGGASVILAIDNPELAIPSPGAVFLERDVLIPAAAVLASNQAAFEDLGSKVDPAGVQPLLLPLPDLRDKTVVGEAWWINHRGHVQTNISAADLEMIGLGQGAELELRVGASRYRLTWELGSRQSDGFVYLDDSGLIAVGVVDGDPADEFSLAPGVAVTLADLGSRTTIR